MRFLRNRIEKLCNLKGSMELIDLENEDFILRFAKKKDYDYALHEGPWIISEHYLTM